ncbi:MAG: TusE/DsrC/DsvC family sulfur relay protein [Verrucomicrobia bacterium]|nr:TusE/DsrC/DsvC family sulfur relay protein [Verrucomicrobiota bacterium]
MPEKTIAGQIVELDEEGYLKNPVQWTKEIAVEIAKEEGIPELTPAHWRVIEFLQKDFRERGEVPGMRRLHKVGGIPTKELFDLFPGGPIKKAARIGGLPKPASCV